jgi:DNA-directed RNA polymerase subunit RPC12/RpoP
MSEEMECMCLECGASGYLPKNDISMDDPANIESKLLDSLLVCQSCGGRLSLVGKAGDEPRYRLK